MWREIEGYEGLYWVNESGEVKNAKGQIKGQKKNNNGHMRVWLSKSSKKTPHFVHRLVAKAFIPNPNNKPIVNHLDGVKNNNCVSNLEWATRSENDLHAFKLGFRQPTCGGTSKKVQQINLNGELVNIFNSLSHASRETGFTIQNISYCANGKTKTANGYVWRFVKV